MRYLLRDRRQKKILTSCELKITNQVYIRVVRVRVSVRGSTSYKSTVTNYKRIKKYDKRIKQ